MRKENNKSCKIGSLLVCIFFYVQNSFPTIGTIGWDRIREIMEKISILINILGENFEAGMYNYFEEFRTKMRNRMRISKLAKEKFYD